MEGDSYGPAALHARLFDPISIHFCGHRIDPHMPAQTVTLLAFILTRRETVLRRDEIALRLWPDAATDASRATLRRHLYSQAAL